MTDSLGRAFAALADPTRRAIVSRLVEGRASVSELAEPFRDRMSLPAVTKHLQVLERAGLVTKVRDAQRRLCELNPEGFRDAAAFLEPYRRMWEESLDRLGEYLDSVVAEGHALPEETPHDRPDSVEPEKAQRDPPDPRL